MQKILFALDITPEDGAAIDNAAAQNGIPSDELARRLLVAYSRAIQGKAGGAVQRAPNPDAGERMTINIHAGG